MILDIVMPFWGRFDHLKEAVESVLAQDDERWRLYVIDDAYPDTAPGEWVAALDDSRVSYSRNLHNEGVSRAFNRAIATGESGWLVIMGCDDVMEPGYVATVLAAVQAHPDASIIECGVRVIDEDGAVVMPLADRMKARLRGRFRAAVGAGEPMARSLLAGNWLYFPSLAWRRDAIASVGFDPADRVVQDLRAILTLVWQGHSIAVVDDVVFTYRRHRSSVSSASGVDGARFAEERALFATFARRARERGWRSAERAARRRFTSRLHALATLPAALRAGNASGVGALVRHACGR